MSSKAFGEDSLAIKASFHAAGEVAVACSRDAAGFIERAARELVMDSREAIVFG